MNSSRDVLARSQSNINWTVIGIGVGAVVTITAVFVTHFLAKRRDLQKAQRDAELAEAAAKSADKKQRDSETAKWRNGFREVVVHLRTEMVRGQIPSDWFNTFERTIPMLNRIAATMPGGMAPEKRTEIHAIVDELTSMSAGQGSEAVYGAQKVVEMLERLEELTENA